MNIFLNKEQLADLKPEDISFIYKQLTVKIFMVVGLQLISSLVTQFLPLPWKKNINKKT